METWEVADEHREGRRMNVDVPEYQTCHIFKGRAKGMKHRQYTVGGHAPSLNLQRPKCGKGLERGNSIGEE